MRNTVILGVLTGFFMFASIAPAQALPPTKLFKDEDSGPCTTTCYCFDPECGCQYSLTVNSYAETCSNALAICYPTDCGGDYWALCAAECDE